jgi:hypothetical protein
MMIPSTKTDVVSSHSVTDGKIDTVDTMVDGISADVKKIGNLVIKTADCTGATPISLFTVTGDVKLKVIGVVKTSLTTSDAITTEVGVSGATAALIAQVADATALTANLIWHDATPDATIESSGVWSEFIVSNGQDIILTTSGTVTDGSIAFYCYWTPLSSDGAVVAA